MVIVTRDWADKYIHVIEEPRSKKNMKKYVIENIKPRYGGYETELTGANKYDIAHGLKEMCFMISIPGYGWCGAMTKGWYQKYKKFIARPEKKQVEVKKVESGDN